MQINVCIFGVSGYTGAQLLYFLENHKHVNLVAAFGSESVGKKIKDLHLNSDKYANLIISNYENFNFSAVDLIFSCLPHGDFQSKIIQNLDESIPLIDLSGDFRLDDLNQYQKFYDKRHDAKEKNKKFVYGLSEIYKKKIKNSKFIANPGCYPTSILIPLIPLVRDKLVSNEHIIIDSKSGVSGAGKRLETKYLFAELNENFFSYGIEKHKHIAEIDQELSKFGQNSFSFIPSLLPVTRGLQSTIYIDKKSDVSSYKSCLKDFYEKEHFIKILDKKPPSLKDVVNTNSLYLNIFEDYSKEKIIIISCIDNLIKGAAGQAIQNMNLMFNFDEKESLI